MNAALTVALVFVGCGPTYLSPGPGPAPLGRAIVLRPEAVLLDDRAVHLEVTSDAIHVVGDVVLAPGHVVVGRRAGGYLRRVVQVESVADGVWLHTAPASLAEVFLEASAAEQITLDHLRAARRWDLGGTVLFDDTLGDEVASARVTVVLDDGAYAEVEPTFELTLDWWDDTTNVGFDTTVRFDAVADVVATVDGAVDFAHDQPLGSQTVPFEFWIGPVPVVGEATIELVGHVELEAQGRLTQTLHTEAHASAAFAAGYAGQWWTDGDADASVVCDPGVPQAEGTFRAKAALTARVSTTLYGAATPYAEVTPWVEASSCDAGLSGVRVDSGVDGAYGGSADVFGWELASFGPEPFAFGPWLIVDECP